MINHSVDDQVIYAAHQARKESLERQIAELERQLEKEKSVYFTFTVIEETNSSGDRQFYRLYADGSRSSAFGSYAGCVRWYMDGGR